MLASKPCVAVISCWWMLLLPDSVILLLTVFDDKLMPSNSFFLSGQLISLAFIEQSFMTFPSVKGRDHCATRFYQIFAWLINTREEVSLFWKKCFEFPHIFLAKFARQCTILFPIQCVIMSATLSTEINCEQMRRRVQSLPSVTKYKFSHLFWKIHFSSAIFCFFNDNSDTSDYLQTMWHTIKSKSNKKYNT